MRPDEIKPGRTYEGDGGDRVVVVAVKTRRWPSGRTSRQAWFFFTPGRGYVKPTRQNIDGFAAWAVREVSGDER